MPEGDAAAFLRAQASDLPADRLALVEMIREGLPYAAVEQAAEASGLGVRGLAHYGAVPARTLSHSRRSGRLSPTQSDRVVRLLRVWRHARAAFGAPDKARAWLERPSRALDGRTPAALLDTNEGARLVEELLGRIEHGIAA